MCIMKPDILEVVLTHLKLKALNAIRYRDITALQELEKYLSTIFGTSHSVQYL